MRTITTASGTTIDLDGDVLAVLEAVSRDLMRRHALDYGFEEVAREFQHLIDQLSEEDLRTYLKESLFLNTVKYENDKLDAYMRKISSRP